MKYYEYLTANKSLLLNQLEALMVRNKAQSVGSGYIDCIVLKDKLDQFVNEISSLGILISDVSWWCYVDPANGTTECPHGMGGPKSDYFPGWFSELQNNMYEVDKDKIALIVESYDKHNVKLLNQQTVKMIRKILEETFKYTPSENIEGNNCVLPGLWLLVPENWQKFVIK
ncbi:hypothetical protein DNH61_02485 [Paenibacillus sambharensis]|uniref:Uncharacterized protein n=1 Tax=Paenibacillus sambharensis TaxID=1803190 RepID=A0A2W1LAH4_9BACL|nr:hypothetical protein [Paenibacillus sambharensis]PZD97248.1 hypothetical protein DNH61_02485 [Paenibacillus sambharensis]